jgi:hypothetical protein
MMKIRDLIFRDRDGLLKSRSSPHTNGSGGYGPQVVSPAELAELRELRQLRARRDQLAAEEREAERRLLRLRAELDDVSTTLLDEARSTVERSVTMTILEFFGSKLGEWAKSTSQDAPFMLGLGRAFRQDAMSKLQPGPPAPENLRMREGPPQRTPAAEAVADPVKLAADIVQAGRRAAARDPASRPRFIPGPPQPRREVTDPQRLAEQIVRAGRRVRDGD